MTTALTGWGRTSPTHAHLVPAETDLDLERLVRQASARGVTARGLGRSYGDAAQNAGGRVIDMTTRNRTIAFDPESGLLTVEAGASLDALMREMIPQGWFVPVTPGTRYVTVGGAIAADIHGKNHHGHGSFCRHVTGIRLLCGDGAVRHTGPGDELFRATAGGMGLTGLILSATIRLQPVQTAELLVDTERATDLDDLMDRLVAAQARHPYAVAWIDCLARGTRLGRGVVTSGRHALRGEVGRRGNPLSFAPRTRLTAPFAPSGLLNRITLRAFNEMWYRRSPRRREAQRQSLAGFFHPLDGIARWNRLYGPKGFVQYQFLVPPGAEPVLRQTIDAFATAGLGSFLAVLKLFGPAGQGLLSFPAPGWTLALDIPVAPGLGPLLDRLDEQIAEAGGRVYLAKDARMRAETLRHMYPRLPEFRRVRDRVDPNRVFTSDLARRLEL